MLFISKQYYVQHKRIFLCVTCLSCFFLSCNTQHPLKRIIEFNRNTNCNDVYIENQSKEEYFNATVAVYTKHVENTDTSTAVIKALSPKERYKIGSYGSDLIDAEILVTETVNAEGNSWKIFWQVFFAIIAAALSVACSTFLVWKSRKNKAEDEKGILIDEIRDLIRHYEANARWLSRIEFIDKKPLPLYLKKMKTNEDLILNSHETYRSLDKKITRRISHIKLRVRNINIELDSLIHYIYSPKYSTFLKNAHLFFVKGKMDFIVEWLTTILNEISSAKFDDIVLDNKLKAVEDQHPSSGIIYEIDDITRKGHSENVIFESKEKIKELNLKMIESQEPKALPTIYAMAGIPGSGKTDYVRKNLSNGVFLISPDLLMESIPEYIEDKRKLGSEKAFEKWEIPARELSYQLLEKAVARKIDVVIDMGASRQENYDMLKRFKKKHEYKLQMYWMDTPLRIALERIERREDRHTSVDMVSERYLSLQYLKGKYISLVDDFFEISFDPREAVTNPLASKTE